MGSRSALEVTLTSKMYIEVTAVVQYGVVASPYIVVRLVKAHMFPVNLYQFPV